MTPAGTSIDVQNEWEENTHTHTHTLYLTFVTAGVRYRSASSSSGIYMGFMGVIIRTKGKQGFCFIGFSTVQYNSVVVLIYDNSVIEPYNTVEANSV